MIKKILILTNDRNTLEVLLEDIVKKGVEIFFVENINSAQEVIEKEKPALIFAHPSFNFTHPHKKLEPPYDKIALISLCDKELSLSPFEISEELPM